MHLYLVNTMNRMNVDTLTFFRSAHQWAFGKDAHLHNEVAQYELNAVIPPFVRKYVMHIQETTT